MSQSRVALLVPVVPAAATGNLCPPCQGGQGTVEFLLAAAAVLLLGLSSLEAIHWYFARQAVSLALTQAARAAITQHAHPAVLDAAFSEALLPMHAGPTPAASQARLARAIARREHATGLPAWRIRIVSPSSASFADFASTHPDLGNTGRPTIDNDYLQEQHLARLAEGWPQGRGPQSGQTTLEANTLSLHLTWLHEPLLPGMKQLLKQLAPSDARYGSQAMSLAGYLPLHRQVALVMQSHPIEWQMPAHGRITRLSSSPPLPLPAQRESRFPAHGQSGSQAMESTRAETDANTDPALPPAPAGAARSGKQAPAATAAAGTQTTSCTGLWCLDVFKVASFLQEPGHGTTEDGVPNTNIAETRPAEDAGDEGRNLRQDDAYGAPDADADAGAEPAAEADAETSAGLEDCPGCCD